MSYEIESIRADRDQRLNDFINAAIVELRKLANGQHERVIEDVLKALKLNIVKTSYKLKFGLLESLQKRVRELKLELEAKNRVDAQASSSFRAA